MIRNIPTSRLKYKTSNKDSLVLKVPAPCPFFVVQGPSIGFQQVHSCRKCLIAWPSQNHRPDLLVITKAVKQRGDLVHHVLGLKEHVKIKCLSIHVWTQSQSNEWRINKKNTYSLSLSLSLTSTKTHNGYYATTARNRRSFINFNPVHGQGILCTWPVQCHNVDRTVRLRSMGDLRHGNRGSGNTTPEAPEPYAARPISVYTQTMHTVWHEPHFACQGCYNVMGKELSWGSLIGLRAGAVFWAFHQVFPQAWPWELWCNFMRVSPHMWWGHIGQSCVPRPWSTSSKTTAPISNEITALYDFCTPTLSQHDGNPHETFPVKGSIEAFPAAQPWCCPQYFQQTSKSQSATGSFPAQIMQYSNPMNIMNI